MSHLINIATSPLKGGAGAAAAAAAAGAAGARAAGCMPKPKFGGNDMFQSEFKNGLRICCKRPEGGTIATCTLMFQAGSRYEGDEDLGAAHFVRACSFMTGIGSQKYIKCRYLQQHGGYLNCCGDRQYTAFTLRCPPPVFPWLASFLLDSGPRNMFSPWEMEEARRLVKRDLQRRHRQQHVVDLIQKATFRVPLANSIYCEEGRVDSISAETIKNFMDRYFTPSSCSIGADGAYSDEVVRLASNVDTQKTCGLRKVGRGPFPQPAAFSRGGYEFHDTGPHGDTYMAFAVPAAGAQDIGCVLAHAILAAACGLGSKTAGQHRLDRILQAPLALLAERHDPHTHLGAFNMAYNDTGIFGILCKTHPSMARVMGFRTAEFFFNINQITPEQIMVGKQRLVTAVSIADGTGSHAALGLALQAAYNVKTQTVEDLVCMIKCIPVETVQAVASQIACKRCCAMAMAVVGDVESAPHDGELRPRPAC